MIFYKNYAETKLKIDNLVFRKLAIFYINHGETKSTRTVIDFTTDKFEGFEQIEDFLKVMIVSY